MVCKEEVLLWFKDLDGHSRIDVLYEILNMCLPFELRFIGSCIEELGKHTYQELRGPTLIANDLEKLSKDVSFSHSISDESVRHRLMIYLSLLSSRNHSVASWLYRTLLRTEFIEEYLVADKGTDETLHSEFLLLFTMALHHPAFSFEHKQFFSRILVSLVNIRENRVSPRHSSLGYPPGFGYPTTFMHMEVPFVPVKMSPMLSGDSPSSVFHHPPVLQQRAPHTPPPPPSDCIASVWSGRPGFPYGAPEVPPFPAPAISPLVSQATSPSQSRNTSPHRTVLGRPITAAPLLPQHSNVPPSTVMVPPMMTVPPPQMCRPLPPPNAEVLGAAGPIKGPTHEQPSAEDDPMKLEEKQQFRDLPWPPNGVRQFPAFAAVAAAPAKLRPFLVEQTQALALDAAENSLHQSNSPTTSSSSSSDSPPGTPRANGPPTSTFPPPYPQPFPSHHHRSVFPPSYRPHFAAAAAAPFQGFSGGDGGGGFPAAATYAVPYYFMYSSGGGGGGGPYQRRAPLLPPGCYNCGAAGHGGGECRDQNVDEITDKTSYRLDFSE